jgi:predicted Fe-Mo cluster-binding NifX family protein
LPKATKTQSPLAPPEAAVDKKPKVTSKSTLIPKVATATPKVSKCGQAGPKPGRCGQASKCAKATKATGASESAPTIAKAAKAPAPEAGPKAAPVVTPTVTSTPKSSPPRKTRNLYKPERLAVASETGENVDACFGRVENFRIYGLVNEGDSQRYELLEIRPGPHPCQDKKHDQAILTETAELLGDCGLVLAGKIGPGATQALSERGILGLAAHLSIEEALRKLVAK